MSEIIKFVIPGNVKSKDRPRFAKVGNYVKTYTSEKTANYENWVKVCFQQANQDMVEGQLKANIQCYFAIPNSYSQKKKNDALKGVLRPTKKPDVDNIAKIILDALNGLAYKDDSQIVCCTIEKWYATESRVEVEIEKL